MAIRGTGLKTGQVVSHLLVRGVAQAIGFYKQALGAVELYRSPLPDGKGLHAQLRFVSSDFMTTLDVLKQRIKIEGEEPPSEPRRATHRTSAPKP